MTAFERYLDEPDLERPLLTKDQEIELSDKIRLGDDEAKETLVLSNLRFVLHIAKRYVNGTTFDIGDLVCVGNIGLIRAAELFKPEFGARFSVYSAFWVKQSMMRHLDDHGRTIRIPCYLGQQQRRLSKLTDLFRGEFGRDPTAEELSEVAGLPGAEVARTFRETEGAGVISLSAPVGTGDDACELKDLIPDRDIQLPDTLAGASNDRAEIEAAVKLLPDRLRKIASERFGFFGCQARTLEEIGLELKLTKERVRQLEAMALPGVAKTLCRRGFDIPYDLIDRLAPPHARKVNGAKNKRKPTQAAQELGEPGSTGSPD